MTDINEKQKKKKKGSAVYTLLYLLCIAVFLFSAYKVVDGLYEYHKAEKLYEKTQQEYVNVPSAEEEDVFPISVDFDELIGINDDIVGWVYMEDTVVNYPVLQSTNNKYYLDRTLYEEFLASGSIFMDYRNSGDFTDSHTVIYGHNMKNHTMFGDMNYFEDPSYLEEHPYVYILLPDGKCLKYEIYSAYTADIEDGTFELYKTGNGGFSSFIDLTLNKNIYSAEDIDEKVLPDAEDKVLTLSTCTEDSDDYRRFVVHAVLVEDVTEKDK